MRSANLKTLVAAAVPVMVAAVLYLVSAPAREAPAAMIVVAVAGAAAAVYASLAHAPKLRALRDVARGAARGELDRPFPSDEDPLIGELAEHLEGLRKAFQAQLRD